MIASQKMQPVEQSSGTPPTQSEPRGPQTVKNGTGASNVRILVVDDTATIHVDFRKILTRHSTTALDESEALLFGTRTATVLQGDFEVDSAYQGGEAYELVAKARNEGRPYAMAFLDIRMPPGWDGIETATHLWSADPELQVVICTAHSDYSWEEIAQRLGKRDSLLLLKKPFDQLEVLQLAHSLTQKWALARKAKLRLEDLERMVDGRTLELRLAEQRVLRLNRLYSVLCKINELIVRARSFDTLCREACQIAVEDGQLRLAWIGLANESSHSLEPLAKAGSDVALLDGFQISTLDEHSDQFCPAAMAAKSGHYSICDDLELDTRTGPWREAARLRGIRSIAAFPLSTSSGPTGVVAFYSAEPNYFTPDEVTLLERLTDDLAFASDFLKQAQELRLRGTALESTVNSVVITDNDGVVLWHNEAFTRITGYNRDEVIGHKTNLIKSGKHPEKFYEQMWQTILSGQTWRGEIVNRRKDGRLYVEEMAITPVRNDGGEITHFVAIKDDITERKRHELRSAAFSSLGQRLSTAKTANEAARIVMEVADELLGWDAFTFDLFSPEDNVLTQVLTIDLIEGQRREFTQPAAHEHPSALASRVIQFGGQLFLRDSAQPRPLESHRFGDVDRVSASILYVPIRNGEKVLAVFSIHSYQHRAYDLAGLEVLLALADHCAGALDRINTEEALRHAQEQLRQAQKMEAIGQLAGGVAHDFNNLLAVIRGNIEIVMMEPSAVDPESKECLKAITTAADRAADLTRQLLAFGRKQALKTQVLNLNEVVANLSKMLERIIGENIKLLCDYTTSEVFVSADLGLIEQVVLNLVINARDAMRRTGGELQLRTERIALEPKDVHGQPEARAGAFAVLTVADTGSGIAAEHLPRIFEPFFTTKELGKGTGLGLATVYGVVKQHRGWISVSSQPGKGSQFRVFLPAAEAPIQVPVEIKEHEAGITQGTETILLVEDDPMVRTMTQKILRHYGYKVEEANSGPAAIEMWHRHSGKFDLLLTDVVMPEGLTGFDLAERLRKQRPNLKVVFMSGYSAEAADPDSTLSARSRKYLVQKPCTAEELLKNIRQCLEDKE